MHLEHKGHLYAVVSTIAVSITAVFIKCTEAVSLETMIFCRFFIAFLLITPNLIREKVHIHVKHVPKHILRALFALFSLSLYFYSVQLLPLVDAVTLANATPLFMPLVIFFWLKLIIPRARVIALIIGFIGVVIILRPIYAENYWPNFVGLTGALCSAFSLVGIRQLSKTESALTIMAYYFLISSVIVAIPMILFWKPIVNSMDLVYLFLVALFSTIAQFCVTKSIAYSTLTKTGSLSYLGVLFSGLLGWWIFNEVPSLWTLAGTALIILGGMIAVLSKDPPRKRAF